MGYWHRKYLMFFISLNLYFYIQSAFDQYIHQLQGISWVDCKKRCNEEARCLSARYLHRFYLCKMYDTLLKTEVKTPGTHVHVKNGLNSDIGCKDIEEGLECYKVCPVPRIDGASRDGNLFDVGRKIKFTCRETGRSETIQCLSNGSWSVNTLFCTSQNYSACDYPGTVLHGQLGTLSTFNGSHGILNVSCDANYTLICHVNILCEASTGNWSGFGNFCCDKLKISNWTKIYSLPKGRNEGILDLYTGKEDLSYINTPLYRNGDVLVNWEDTGVAFVNFTVVSDGIAVAYMLFNGTGTNMTSWFSIGNLLQSSWSDLQPSTQVQYFSFNGNYIENRRWFVAQNTNENMCTEDTGWFVVTWDYYPCNGTKANGQRILYAKNGSASKFVQEELGFADKFEIWIQK